MARTIHEIEIPRQRVGACDIVGKVYVEEPPGSTHDPLVAAEAAAVARELEEAIEAVIAGCVKPMPEPIEAAAKGVAGLGLLKR
jgi:hypothetical protein